MSYLWVFFMPACTDHLQSWLSFITDTTNDSELIILGYPSGSLQYSNQYLSSIKPCSFWTPDNIQPFPAVNVQCCSPRINLCTAKCMDRVSGTTCYVLGWCSTWCCTSDSLRAHLDNLALISLSFSSQPNALWSVIKVNLCPYMQHVNCLVPNITASSSFSCHG